MGIKTAISWCDSTHNFWYGCKKVSAGCAHCYAERDMKRYGMDFSTVTKAKGFAKPLRWEDPRKVFVNSWSDFFIEEADQWRDKAWRIIKATPHLTYQILTKRPERIAKCLPFDWLNGYKNVWLGVTIENNENIKRLEYIYDIPAVIRFVSCEPMLNRIGLDFELTLDSGMRVDWVISGGESGVNARNPDMDWFRFIRDQCKNFDIPYFHKQNGGNKKINGVWGGDMIDGKRYKEMPE